MREDFSELMTLARFYYKQDRKSFRELLLELKSYLGVQNERAMELSLLDLRYAPEVTKQLQRRTMHRLAANKLLLQRGVAAPVNPRLLKPQWAVAIVKDVKLLDEPGSDGNPARIRWLIYSGPLAGKRFTQHIKHDTDGEIYQNCAGKPRKCPYESPKQLLNMRAALLLGFSEGDFVFDEQLGITRKLRSHNVELAHQRSRAYEGCQFRVPVDCVHCHVGVNECERSLNKSPTELVKRPYPNFEYVAHSGETLPEVAKSLASKASFPR